MSSHRPHPRDIGATWGDYLRAARKGAGLSQRALAEASGVITRQTIYRWERGEFRPEKARDVIAVADALRVDREEALHAAGLLPSPLPPPRRPAAQEPADPELRRLVRWLTDPTVNARTKELIRSQLAALVELAERTDPGDPGDRRAS